MNDDVTNGRRDTSNAGSDPWQGAHPAVEQLSAHLDGDPDIQPAEREAITGHLASCRECQAVVADLRTVVHALGELPQVEAPRAFALTREMVEPATRPEPRPPVVMRESAQWHARHAAKIRWATAVAAILFVFTVSADLVLHGFQRTGSSPDDDMSAITMMEDDAESAGEARMADEPESIPTAAAAQGMDDDEAPPQDDAADEEPVLESADADLPESDEPVQDSDESAGGFADDDAADDVDGEISALSFEEEEIAGEPTSEVAELAQESSQSRWKIAQVSLALVLALLLAVMIGLPKQRGSRRR